MASTFSPSLRIELIGDGDQSGIWGQTTNNNLGALIEQAIAGVIAITMADANYTMTNFNGVVDEARNQVIVLTGVLSAQRNLIAPLVEKTYVVKNTTTGGFGVQIIGSSGTGVTIPNGVTTTVYCDGTIFFSGISGTTGSFTATSFSGAGTGLTGIPNAATTAVSTNTPSTIVLRDSNGSFAANVVSATSVSATSVSAANASATNFSTTNFTITESAGVLQIKNGATVILTIDSTGNLTAKSNVTAFGSI